MKTTLYCRKLYYDSDMVLYFLYTKIFLVKNIVMKKNLKTQLLTVIILLFHVTSKTMSKYPLMFNPNTPLYTKQYLYHKKDMYNDKKK